MCSSDLVFLFVSVCACVRACVCVCVSVLLLQGWDRGRLHMRRCFNYACVSALKRIHKCTYTHYLSLSHTHTQIAEIYADSSAGLILTALKQRIEK